MRSFLKQFATPVLIGLAVVVVLVAVAVGIALLHRGRAPSNARLVSRSGAKLDAYTGLGAWVDLWDKKAWRDPAAAVADMNAHGVHTLYLQTGTARSADGIANVSATQAFIAAAHARDMYVVAWYLPNLKTGSVDFVRIRSAVEFATSDGQKFDSVAIDIESTTVKPFAARNRNLATLSKQVRDSVGPTYPLGGIIPSPVGLKKQTGFWDVFPYANVAAEYDVLLPMGYYTYHGHTADKAHADAVANMRILRAQPGCATIPVHLIGGIAGNSSAAQVGAFARGARETGCIGASIYDWVGTSDAKWHELSAVWAKAR